MILNLQIAQHSIITTWHSDFEEGIWFSIFGADHTEIPIDKVVFLDMTRGMRQADLQTALNKIEQSAAKFSYLLRRVGCDRLLKYAKSASLTIQSVRGTTIGYIAYA